MQTIPRRLLSIILAMLLVFGLSVNAFAAEDTGGIAETIPVSTESTETAGGDAATTDEVSEAEFTTSTEETAVPEETTGSEDITETEGAVEPETVPEDTETAPDETEVTDEAAAPEETVTPEDTEDEQPDIEEEVPSEDFVDVSDFNFTEPILGYDPSDPDNPYPFGIPVDNFFPADLMEFSNSGIMLLAAVQGSIPDEMWDNSILRALAYTGYNVQKLKDNGWLYRYEYVGSRLKTNAPDVMTNIGYGAGSNGNETIADPSTPTGRAPDISYFERNGLVCASFVAYYLSNYLPNVEGVDTSHIINKVQELSGGNMRAVSNWRTGLSALANDPTSGVTKYTDAATAYANLVPGDVIAFRNNSGEWPHVGIYAGTSSFLRADGTNLGTYHFLIHVGNDRGPEISVVEYMAQSGNGKDSYAAEWYHLELNSTPNHGYGRLRKETNTGNNLGGWKINLYTDASCTQLVDGSPFTIPDSGVLDVELAPGDYWCREVPVNDPYWICDTSTQKLTIVSGETSTVTFKNAQYGRGRIIKSMPDGGSLEGWSFDVYRKSDNYFIGTYTSGADGTVLTGFVLPGEYVIYEKIPEDSLYYCEAPNPQTITVKAGEIAEVTFTNRIRPGKIDILKVDGTNAPRAGAEFLLEWSEDGMRWSPVTQAQSVTKGGCTSTGLVNGRLTSDSTGSVSFEGLHPELHYRLSETKAPDGLQMLTGYAYEGELPLDRDLSVSLRVVNTPIFTLPETGGNAFGYLPVATLLCCAFCAVAFIYARRRKTGD